MNVGNREGRGCGGFGGVIILLGGERGCWMSGTRGRECRDGEEEEKVEEKRKEEEEQVHERGQKNIESEFAQFDSQLQQTVTPGLLFTLFLFLSKIKLGLLLPILMFTITGTYLFSLPPHLLILHLNNLTTIIKGVQQSECTPLVTEMGPSYSIPRISTQHSALSPYSPLGAGKSMSCGTNENMNMMNLRAKCLGPFVNGFRKRCSGEGSSGEGKDDNKIHASGAKFKCHRLWEQRCQAAPGQEWLEAKAMHAWK
ncbi:hypothetical protein GE21DRAFT_2439 [Neurospora crassa]|uniref:Uncharacterized protein n=1 Tax=Neurospora crassa (strain ATCC 24698 / 74-OR23-1A / CBS 708.71 / DSM 1257 / FGSC 987) TaxID=367110 RepID=Q7SDQ2_NEUCR|nr:hypothetical protein NCU02854 [Neurospora crassa OR74A]EAA34908.3 hypothetical protein NCU02854 [Neurospora crassa OR74A]KHE81969.1 hypothetical protein GE21DRAFT_2439 [Neurospora crassa]|eukprot:XP_964144.3 hypothetical protein NCU02854 [Neurospora crassa OR74A]